MRRLSLYAAALAIASSPRTMRADETVELHLMPEFHDVPRYTELAPEPAKPKLSRYQPHQNSREMKRRLKRLAKAGGQ